MAIDIGEELCCDVIDAPCDHYSYQLDMNGQVAITHCTHPKNPSEYEGNTTPQYCPLRNLCDE